MKKNKKSFNAAKAAELKVKYSLKDSTIIRWEKLGYIPKKYLQESGFLINGHNLKDCRNLIGKSQQEVVEEIQQEQDVVITTISLSQWENGKNEPRTIYKNVLRKYYETRVTTGESN